MRSPGDPAADEPIRNHVEHFGSSPVPTDAADEPFRNHVEHFGSSLASSDAADEPIRHDAERFPIAPASGQLSRPAEIGDIYLAADEPDVPDGVLPYAAVLCDRQQLAIELLLSGEGPCAVAQKLGIGRTTLWRWRTYDWQFRRALAAARQAIFGEAVERLRGLVPQAVDVLQARMAGGSDLAAVRLLRLARVDRYEPETEDNPEPDHTPWPEALHDR